MPCPTCDAELSRELVASAVGDTSKRDDTTEARVAPACPACGQPLLAVQIAGPLRRVAATLVDLVVLAATALPLQLLLWKVAPVVDPIPGAKGLHRWIELATLPVSTLLAMIVPLLVMTALYLVLHWGLIGRTIGQRALGLRVVDGRGADPGWVRSTLRVAATGIGLVPAGLGALWMLFDDERRTFQDHIAGTWVVIGS